MSLRSHALLSVAASLALAYGAGGCGPSKTVTLTSEPSGARVNVLKSSPKEPTATPVSLSSEKTPVTVNLPFAAGEMYKVVMSQDQFLDNTLPIALEPQSQKDYRLSLVRYLADSVQTVFTPRFEDRTWVLEPRFEKTLAYVLDDQDPGVQSKNPTAITNNRDPNVDFQSIAASPATDLIAYQRVERRKGRALNYVVPSGSRDTLAQIAQSQDVSLEELLRSNPDLDPERRPTPGTTLRIERMEVISEVYKQPSNGGAATRLTNDQTSGLLEVTPTFNGTGDSIIFSSNTSSPNQTLWSIKVEGGGTRLTRVTQSAALDYHPSVGGDTLAYTSLPPRGSESTVAQLWVAKVDGLEPSKIGDGESATISPDDRLIAYVLPLQDRSGRSVSQLWVMNVDGTSRPVRLFNNLDYDVIDPHWSPDLQWIVYAANPAPGGAGNAAARGAKPLQNYDLFRVRVDGSAPPERLTSNPGWDSSPTFDATGKFIYFRSNRGGSGAWNIWRIEVPDAARKPAAAPAR